MYDIAAIQKRLENNDGYHSSGGECHEGRIRETLAMYERANREEEADRDRRETAAIMEKMPEWVAAHKAAIAGYDPANGEQTPVTALPIRQMFDEWATPHIAELRREIAEFSARIGMRVAAAQGAEQDLIEVWWAEKRVIFLRHYLMANRQFRPVRRDGSQCFWVKPEDAVITDFVINTVSPWITVDNRPSKLVPPVYRPALNLSDVRKKLQESA